MTSEVDDPTVDPDATARTRDTLGHAIDGALEWDDIEERGALARVEQSLFARTRVRQPLQLSRYLLLRPLGSGGTGIVYDGYDPELSRRVAVKVLRAGRKNKDEVERARARFLREAKSIAQLSHANVIGVYDVGTYEADALTTAPTGRHGPAEGEGVFIVMELVEGADVASWLERSPRSWKEVVEVFAAAGEGLAAAHTASIAHRDFKPGNVLVGDDGRVKVVDFGLALTYGGGSLSQSMTPTPAPTSTSGGGLPSELDDAVGLEKLTRTGAVLGTPAYMAPEQHRGEPADQKADQFAFCASLYRSLYGHHAFEGRSLEALFANKAEGRVRSVPDSARVPGWVHRVVLRGLEADPDQRFADMPALLRALRADPVRRAQQWTRRAAVPLGVAGLAYAGWVGTRPGTVSVTASAAGQPVADVRVYVDDEVVVGQETELAAGLHRVRVTAPSYEPAERVVEVARGGTHQVAVELEHEQGTLTVELAPAGGHVFIDGADYGSRLRGLSIDTGPHELLLRHHGYVDQRLDWTVHAGETRDEFVALRKALLWSRDASGVYRRSEWLGDVDRDGLDDLVHRRFTVLTAYDPWDDAELWRIELGSTPFYRLCDVNGDGVADPVTIKVADGERELRVFDGASEARRPEPLWTVAATVLQGTWAELVCIAADDGADDLLAIGLDTNTVTRIDGREGNTQWTAAALGMPLHAVVLDGGERPGILALVGSDGVHGLDRHDGRRLWSTPLSVAPLDGDGVPERPWARQLERSHHRQGRWAVAAPLDHQQGEDLLLQVQSDNAELVVALGGEDGALLWRVPVDEVVELAADEVVGDVDGDGSTDVLVRYRGRMSMTSGRTGRSMWSAALDGQAPQVLGSLPVPMVAVRGPTGLELLDAATGQSVATRSGLEISSPVAVSDWDGDARLDLLVGTRDGLLRAFDRQLRPTGTIPMGAAIDRVEAARDANHDGFSDLLLQVGGPAVVAGPKTCWDRRPDEAIRATPVVGDFDGDGEPELAVFGNFGDGRGLHILDARTGQLEVAEHSRATPDVIRPPAVVRHADGLDILALGGILRRYDPTTADSIAEYRTRSGYATPTVADLDGDGRDEVIAASWQEPGELFVFDLETLEPRWIREIGKVGSFGAPHVSDVDGDGGIEIVVAALDGRVICYSAEGEVEWVVETGGRLNFEPVVTDLELDRIPDVLVTPHLDDDPLVVIDGRSGQIRAHWPGVASRRARPVVHDIDADGSPEILLSSASRGLVAVDGDGVLRWEYGFVDGQGLQPGASGSPTLADLDADGSPELLAGFEDGSLHVVDARDGRAVWRVRVGREELEASPAVADVDGDGQLEVFVSTLDRRLLCLEHRPGAPTK